MPMPSSGGHIIGFPISDMKGSAKLRQDTGSGMIGQPADHHTGILWFAEPDDERRLVPFGVVIKLRFVRAVFVSRFGWRKINAWEQKSRRITREERRRQQGNQHPQRAGSRTKGALFRWTGPPPRQVVEVAQAVVKVAPC